MKLATSVALLVPCMASCARAFSSFRPAFRRSLLVAMSSSTSSAAVATNPLLQQEDLPKFEKIEPSDLSPAVGELLTDMEQKFTSLEHTLEESLSKNNDEIKYEMVLPEVERIQFPIGFAWGVAGHLNGVKNGDELRKAYEENQPKIVQAMSKFAQSKPLYDALEAIEHKWHQDKGEEECDSFLARQRRRAVESSLRSMKLGGVGLKGEAKERFNEMKMRLAQLATTFSNNVLDETKAFSLTVDDASKMEGVPESAKAMWANAHATFLKTEGKEDVEMDPEKGPWRITLDMPSYIAVLSHMKDRDIREQVYRANIKRASEANEEKNNIPLIYETLKLKQKMAEMRKNLLVCVQVAACPRSCSLTCVCFCYQWDSPTLPNRVWPRKWHPACERSLT